MNNQMKPLGFSVDDEILHTINLLKVEFNTLSTADVFKKSIALAKIATNIAGDSGVITIRGKNNESGISINLRH